MSDVPAICEVLGDDLADACAADSRWTSLYVAAPLEVVKCTGAPVNPIAIR